MTENLNSQEQTDPMGIRAMPWGHHFRGPTPTIQDN